MSVARFIARRLGIAVLVLFVLSILVFGMVRVIPGDPTAAFVDPNNPDPTQVAQIRAEMGLDRPWWEQYLSWIGGALTGDFGNSLTQPYTVNQQFGLRFPVSFELGVMAIILAVLIGVLAGYLSVMWYKRFGDYLIRLVSFVFLAVPPFVFGTIILLVNSWTVKAPLIGFVPFATDPIGNLRIMIIPALVLCIGPAALISRYTRGNLLDAMQEDYIRTARAKGLPLKKVIRGHALRNAMIPVITIVGIMLGGMIGGTVIIETVFALPGMGTLLIQAINTSDYPTIQGTMLLIGAIYIVMNLIVDVLYPVIDPRARVEGGK